MYVSASAFACGCKSLLHLYVHIVLPLFNVVRGSRADGACETLTLTLESPSAGETGYVFGQCICVRYLCVINVNSCEIVQAYKTWWSFKNVLMHHCPLMRTDLILTRALYARLFTGTSCTVIIT
jgi:hypothetical protein